jgi:SAM-dependent MidA family methyltransferase
MELALYCPNIGYYERREMSPGRGGDFYTSVSVGELFGQLLAAQFAEWLKELPGGSRHIVEAGAHDGRLARDVLRWLKTHRAELADSLEYWIVEPSSVRREIQKENLAQFSSSVSWFASWNDIPKSGVHGVIFSNELLDAMPAHRIAWDAAAHNFFEWGVGLQGDDFVWRRLLASPSDGHIAESFKDLPEELLAVLPDGFTAEICPAANVWWRQAARALHSGKLLALDYGLAARDFFTPGRSEGTLRAYHQHRHNNELLARVGEQDLTAQVNFTAIMCAGETEGLQTEAFISQAQFLVSILEKISANEIIFPQFTSKQTRQFQTLTHPEHLGQLFRALIQSR